MFNHKLMRNIGIGAACVLVPAAVVGGYFGMSQANPYYKYYRTPITADDAGFISAYLSAQYLGAKVLVTPGFTHAGPIQALYNDPQKAEKAKDLGFLLLDEAIDYVIGPDWAPVKGSDGLPLLSKAITNTASITFRADLGSIQTGVAVGQFLNDNVDTFGPADNPLTFGTYGGLPFSSVTCFMGGVTKGIEWFNTNLKGKTNEKTGKPYKEITIVGPKNVGWNFAGGFGPGDGDAIINNYLQEPDLDMFMPVAGPQVWTAQKKIMELKKQTVLVGVDAACEEDALNLPIQSYWKDGDKVGNGKYVQFSSIKDLNKATFNILSIMNNGNKLPDPLPEYKGVKTEESDWENFHASNVGGIGTISVGDATNKCVGVSEAGKPFLEAALEAAGKKDQDPSNDSQYSEPANMTYQYKKTDGTPVGDPDNYSDLRQTFTNVLAPGTYSKDSGTDVKPLDLCTDGKPFIRKDYQPDDNLIKLIISDPTSVLFDGSFSESAYLGMYEFYKSLGITIPIREVNKGGK